MPLAEEYHGDSSICKDVKEPVFLDATALFIYSMSRMKKPKKKVAPKASKPKASSKVKGSTNKYGTPYADRVLVKPLEQEQVTSFGIVLPSDSKEKPEQGTVVAVGPGKKTEDGKIVPVNVKVGDKIMFSKYGYDEVKIDGAEYYLIREDSITFIF